MATNPVASFLTLPPEVRNAVYAYVFDLDFPELQPPPLHVQPDPLAVALQLQPSVCPAPITAPKLAAHAVQRLRVLQTCRQIHAEAHLLALATTPFHVHGEAAYPEVFAAQHARALRPAKLGAVRHVVLTARISHLRALNEAWAGAPFGHAGLSLDALVVVPTRPAVCAAAYAEIADLSQSHALAYVFSETLKRLRRVRRVEVRNAGCFTEVVWRLLYRSLVYRLWRWGGASCGLRFESGERAPGGSERAENQWFRVFLAADDDDYLRGNDVGEEVARLVGQTGTIPDPNSASISP